MCSPLCRQGHPQTESFCIILLPAHGTIFCQDSDILPLCGMPVRKVVPFFRTFVAISVTIRVLSGIGGATVAKFVVLYFLIGNK